MYKIIEESNGIDKEFTIIDIREYKQIGKIYKDKEEATKEVERLTMELYKGSGVLGNEL